MRRRRFRVPHGRHRRVTLSFVQIVEHSVIGTRSAVLRLRRPGTGLQFVVFPMFHVASPQFYAEVSERLRHCDLLVVEGVSGRSVLSWAITATYRFIPANRRSGLVQDSIPYDSLGVPLINPDVTAGEFTQDWRRLPLRTRLLMWLIMPVVAVLQLFAGRSWMLGPEVEVDDLPADLDDHEVAEQLAGVFGGTRDERVLAALSEIYRDRSAERIDVAVVYGAGHTAAIVHGLLKQHGYRPRSSEWLTVVAPSPRATRSVPAPAPEPAAALDPGPVRPEATDARSEFVRRDGRRTAAIEPNAYQAKLASALDTLARRLSDLGRREEALRAADEAVDVATKSWRSVTRVRTVPHWGSRRATSRCSWSAWAGTRTPWPSTSRRWRCCAGRAATIPALAPTVSATR